MSKVALITGAGRGIGAATALRLASDGYDICLCYRQNHQAASEVHAKVMKLGVRAITVQADIADENQVVQLFEEMDRELGRVDLLVNNAGILFQQMSLLEMTAQRINDTFTTNVTGTLLCSREAVRRMSTEHGGEGGVIVNVSSAAARLGSPNEYIDYAASKGAIDTFTVGLAKEVAPFGIRVNAVRPGIIKTEMHASGGEPGRVDRVKSQVPLARGGESEEVAAAIAWLAANESSYTTGSFIEVSGGR